MHRYSGSGLEWTFWETLFHLSQGAVDSAPALARPPAGLGHLPSQRPLVCGSGFPANHPPLPGTDRGGGHGRVSEVHLLFQKSQGSSHSSHRKASRSRTDWVFLAKITSQGKGLGQ